MPTAFDLARICSIFLLKGLGSPGCTRGPWLDGAPGACRLLRSPFFSLSMGCGTHVRRKYQRWHFSGPLARRRGVWGHAPVVHAGGISGGRLARSMRAMRPPFSRWCRAPRRLDSRPGGCGVVRYRREAMSARRTQEGLRARRAPLGSNRPVPAQRRRRAPVLAPGTEGILSGGVDLRAGPFARAGHRLEGASAGDASAGRGPGCRGAAARARPAGSHRVSANGRHSGGSEQVRAVPHQ